MRACPRTGHLSDSSRDSNPATGAARTRATRARHAIPHRDTCRRLTSSYSLTTVRLRGRDLIQGVACAVPVFEPCADCGRIGPAFLSGLAPLIDVAPLYEVPRVRRKGPPPRCGLRLCLAPLSCVRRLGTKAASGCRAVRTRPTQPILDPDSAANPQVDSSALRPPDSDTCASGSGG